MDEKFKKNEQNPGHSAHTDRVARTAQAFSTKSNLALGEVTVITEDFTHPEAREG